MSAISNWFGQFLQFVYGDPGRALLWIFLNCLFTVVNAAVYVPMVRKYWGLVPAIGACLFLAFITMAFAISSGTSIEKYGANYAHG